MTDEEAIRIATGLRTDFKCESDTMVDFCNTIIKALKQKPVLDKIKTEIETEKNAGCHTQYAGGLDFALSIIDKYKEESEQH